jgi:hypothetical protein
MKSKNKLALWTAFLLFALLAIGLLALPHTNLSVSVPEPKQKQKQKNTAVHEVELVQKQDDTVRNPYAPPVRHLPQGQYQYTQMGYLERGPNKTLLFGKPCPTQRRKWLYYSVVNGIKLPVESHRRACTVSPGCDELANGDEVDVDGQPYKVRLYESDMYEYDPFRV